MRMLQAGFTLIELMIVVAIVAILAAIALPAYQDYVGRSQMAEAYSLASGLKVSVVEFYANNATFPVDNAAAQAGPAANIKGKYVAQTTIAGGTITASMKASNVSACAAGKSVALTPQMPPSPTDPISWICVSDALCKPSSCS